MDENFSHKIKADRVVLAYFNYPKNGYTCQVHKAGCAHEAKADSVRPWDGVAGADDWFYVAPCARKA